MKYIAYYDGVYGPFSSEAEAEQKAKTSGWVNYDICNTQEEAQAIVDDHIACN